MATKKKTGATITATAGSSNAKTTSGRVNAGATTTYKQPTSLGGKIAFDYATNGPIVSASTLGEAAGGAAGLAVSGIGAGVTAATGAVGMGIGLYNYLKASKELRKLYANEPVFQQSDDSKKYDALYQSGLDDPTAWRGEGGIGNHPGEYQSPYAEKMQAQLEKIESRPDFNYDFTQDPTYWNYRDQYIREGKLAMQDTAADVSALTGGYGNSYAATAGSQAYQSYLNDLNNVIPTLRDQAFEEYKYKGEDMYKQMNLLQSLDEGEYGKWQDKVNEYYTMLNETFNAAQYYNEQDWQKYLTDISQWQFKINDWRGLQQSGVNTFMQGGQLAGSALMDYGSQVGSVGMQVGKSLGSDLDTYLGNRATNYKASLAVDTSAGTATTASGKASGKASGSGTTKKKSGTGSSKGSGTSDNAQAKTDTSSKPKATFNSANVGDTAPYTVLGGRDYYNSGTQGNTSHQEYLHDALRQNGITLTDDNGRDVTNSTTLTAAEVNDLIRQYGHPAR